MRIPGILEKIHTKFPSQYDPSKEVLIYKNPSNPEFLYAKSKTANNDMHGLLVGNAIYISGMPI
jgi:hypothetical protein